MNIKRILRLYLDFFWFGCFTFGGGWSIIAQMQKTYAEEQKSITNAEILDLTSVGRSLPGTMIGNVAMMYGFREAGYFGGAACLLGMVTMPTLILAVITHFYTIFQANPIVAACMTGIRAAVVPIMLNAVFNMVNGAFRFPPCYAVAVLTFSLYLFFGVSPVWLVVLGILCGFAISEYYERRSA